jgi:hypothetical protein
MPSESENLEIKNRAAERLLGQPGVVAVGLGSKEVGDEPTGELAIKVFVKVKRAPRDVPPEELIPPEIDGIPTDVIESGEIHLDADPSGAVIEDEDTDDTRYRPLTGGGRIAREDSSQIGTMGCLLVDPGDLTKVYGLTNFHVMNASDVPALAVGTSKVGQPTGSGSVTDCCSDLFGKFAGGAKDADRDEALVRLDPGTQWLAEILEIGVVSGKHAVTQAEATPQTYKVRKRGARTRLTGGVVRALNATTHQADNVVVVKPNPNPNAGTKTVFFGYPGDSGSAVVNQASEVVSLHYAHDDSGNGYGYAIQHVLSRFGTVEHVTVDVAVGVVAGTVNTVPGSPMVATPPELADALGSGGQPAPALRPVPPAPPPGWFPDPVPLAAAPAHLERDLDRSPTGRLLITVWLEHQAELLGLINTNRRVAVAWHRSGVAALVQVLMRMPTQPELALPATVNGQPVRAALTRMRATLDRFASPRLSKDLAHLDALLPDVAGLTYPQIIDSLGTG